MADTDFTNIKHQKLVPEQNEANPSKFYSHLLYKALIIVIVSVVILPVFPSQAPEFINQTLLTRSWELLHLVFVGIAVSYGLFSRRHGETEKENNGSKFDNVHSYVSGFLQVSSVFDDEAESPSGSDENKIQTWSSQYYRNEPEVVVAQEHSVIDEQRGTSSRIGEKPLLLPVRSLKSRVTDADVVESANESGSISRSNSKSSSKRFSSNSSRSKNGELGGLEHVELEEKLKENVVLPSPIPWRSRSGRMEMKEDVGSDNSPLYTLSPSMEESEFNLIESRSSRLSRSSRSNSMSSSSSPKLSPSALLSLESQAKNAEDLVRKKSFYKSSPPPPPPPPPPPMIRKSSSVKPNSSLFYDGVSSEKDLRRSLTAEAKELNRNGGENQMSRVNSMGKSVRTGRGREIGEDEPTVGGFDQTSFRTQKLSRESIPMMSKQNFMEEKEEFVDTVTMESDEDTESEDDDVGDIGGSSNNKEAASSSASDVAPDVDKKADEFIAKFREQIRLQRIDSIKRSSGQIKRNSSSR